MELNLHPGQLEVFQDPHKIRVLVCGRRWGKSRLMLYELLMAAMQFPGRVNPASPETVLGTLPTMPQARKVLWNPLVSLVEQTELGKFVKDINRTQFKIDFYNNKPSINIASVLDSGGDRLRGMRLYFYGGDESQDMRWDTFDKVIMPALGDTQGSRVLLTGTPKGTTNILHELYRRADKHPAVYKSFNQPTYQNPTIPWSEVITAKMTLPLKSFRQEYEASFEQPEGQIYSELDESNLVDTVPTMFEYTLMGIDWGETSPAVVVLGKLANVWYLAEAWSPSSGNPVPQPVQDEIIVKLATKYNVKGVFCDPSRPSSILHVRSLASDKPYHNTQGLSKAVAGYNPIDEGITQVHSLIHQDRLKFSRETTVRYYGHVPGYTAYQQVASYHRKVDKNSGLILDVVAENQQDHICDSLRYVIAAPVKPLS